MKDCLVALKNVQAAKPKGSILSAVSVFPKPSSVLDNLTAQESLAYLNQRKHFDQVLRQPVSHLQKLAAS